MEKRRRFMTSEQAGELDLASGRFQQIVAPDHEGDTLPPVVDDRGELIRPVALPIADQQIAALFEGRCS